MCFGSLFRVFNSHPDSSESLRPPPLVNQRQTVYITEPEGAILLVKG